MKENNRVFFVNDCVFLSGSKMTVEGKTTIMKKTTQATQHLPYHDERQTFAYHQKGLCENICVCL